MSIRYKRGRLAILQGEIDFRSAQLAAVLVDTDVYSVDADAHETFDDLIDAAILSTTVLTGVYIDSNSMSIRADACVFVNVDNDDLVGGAVVVFVNDNDLSKCFLLAYIDEDSSDDLPVTPDGDDIVVTWADDGILYG
jgi:hypothetical protein